MAAPPVRDCPCGLPMFSVTRDDTVLYGCSACDAGSRWPVVEQWYADNPEEA